ncbi:hypothetical protein DL769_005862 [Monosporascus sp. CRB-8-3]|nr:hypothetical protein DL769_005862 [Monosporascus sp. CRB-8-3]
MPFSDLPTNYLPHQIMPILGLQGLSGVGAAGDLSQQTLRLLMTELRSIREQGHDDRPGNSASRNDTLTINDVLREIQELRDEMTALAKEDFLGDPSSKDNTPTTNDASYEIQKLGDSLPGFIKNGHEGLPGTQANGAVVSVNAVNNQDVSQRCTVPSPSYFSRLPPEIRCMIYELSFPNRVLMFHPEGPVSKPNIAMRPLSAPSIALTCREAYHFSKKHYQQLRYDAVALWHWYWQKHPPQVPPASHTWFHPDLDALLIDLAEFEVPGYGMAMPFVPIVYNPARNMTGYRVEADFSQIVRSLLSFTTIAKHVILRHGQFGKRLWLTDLLMYGFSENFPELQRISFATYEFSCFDRLPVCFYERLKAEAPVVLLDPYDSAQANEITAMLEADILNGTRSEITLWMKYLNDLKVQESPAGPSIQTGSQQLSELERIQSELAVAQVYAESAYHTGEEGDRTYTFISDWDETVHSSEIEARLKQLPAIKPTCLVMEPAWELREVVSDPREPFKTELHWVRRRKMTKDKGPREGSAKL